MRDDARDGNRVEQHSLTVADIARRWKISHARARAMIEDGVLPSFSIPSAGKYGECVRVLRSIIEAFEREGLNFEKSKGRQKEDIAADKYWRDQLAKMKG